MLPRPAIPLIDGDVYWHIRAGATVLDTGAVPKVDTWSIVGDGMRWISQDWLSNVFLALGWRLGEVGPTVLSFGWALLVVVALALLWWAYGRRKPDAGWLGRIIWLAAGLIVAGPTLGVRVQVVDLTLGAAVLASPVGVRDRSGLALARRPAAAHAGVGEPARGLAACSSCSEAPSWRVKASIGWCDAAVRSHGGISVASRRRWPFRCQ